VEAIEAVGRALDLLPGVPVVLDPVMVAESGARLLQGDAERALRELLVPRATVVTPNLGEAAVLAQLPAGTPPADLARAIHALGPGAVVVTGGHGPQGGDVADVFFDGSRLVEISGERHPDGAAHGSGCTHSSVLAAQLALGLEPLAASRRARALAARAIAHGLRGLGEGAGPVHVLGPPPPPPA
jgi:hydroxymethylpyrimidine/phosphomethylpyrimidine kinase